VRREVELDVQYGQFYLWDPDMPFEPPEDWTSADVHWGLKATPHLLAVAPIRDGPIPVTVELHERTPTHDLAEWDHAVEGSLEIVSGRLELRECLGVRRWSFKARPGWYRARALFGNLASVFVDDEPEEDRYLVAIWPAPPSGVSVLKQFRLAE
jgi:hypothetical protein